MRYFNPFLPQPVLETMPGATGTAAPAAAAPVAPAAGGINSTAVRPDVTGDWPEGELPEQMMGDFSVLMPDISTFRLPANLAQLWAPFEVDDTNPRSKTKGQKVQRYMLKFTREHPLVIIEGPKSGDVLTGTVSTSPRARGKKDNPQTAWVSDAVYLLVEGLGSTARPVGDEALMAEINKYAGQPVRIKHGLSGQCRPDRVVRLEFQDPTDLNFAAEARAPRTVVLEDPGDPATSTPPRKGCGKRYYTRDFENKAATSVADKYFTEVQCEGQIVGPITVENPTGHYSCDAIVRGFPSIEGFVKPVAVK